MPRLTLSVTGSTVPAVVGAVGWSVGLLSSSCRLDGRQLLLRQRSLPVQYSTESQSQTIHFVWCGTCQSSLLCGKWLRPRHELHEFSELFRKSSS